MTKIEWTEATWNPVLGCSRVSKGCEHCYAERVAHRGMAESHRGLTVLGKKGPRWTGEVRFLPDRLAEPLSWRKPRKVFVNSMSDLFHAGVSNEEIAAIFGVMAACPQHTFQVLTKRPERMLEWFRWLDAERPDSNGHQVSWYPFGTALHEHGIGVNETLRRAIASHPQHSNRARDAYWPLPNVWLGVSVEDQATADARIPLLLQAPEAVRWVSYEPALGPVTYRDEWLGAGRCPTHDFASGFCVGPCPDRVRGLDWIVIGGESGPGARPFDVSWARSTINQCRAAGVPVFVKQLGANVRTRNDDNFTIEEDPHDPEFPGWPLHLEAEGRIECNPDGPERYQGAPVRVHLRDRKGGDMSEWRTDLRVREWPEVRHA